MPQDPGDGLLPDQRVLETHSLQLGNFCTSCHKTCPNTPEFGVQQREEATKKIRWKNSKGYILPFLEEKCLVFALLSACFI